MRSLEDRCFAIVSALPQGQRVAELVRSVLWRELKWGAWKEQQCPPLSREASVVLPQEVVVSEDASASAKLADARAMSFGFPKELSEVRSRLQALSDSVPSYASHIADFVDAEDPANGIEDDYHPRHDSVYCWRARRLLADRSLGSFAEMSDGDLRAGLKTADAIERKAKGSAEGAADLNMPWIVLKERVLPTPEAEAEAVAEAEEEAQVEHEAGAEAEAQVEHEAGDGAALAYGEAMHTTASAAASDFGVTTKFDAEQGAEEANGAHGADGDPEMEAPPVCLKIGHYANIETADSIREYIEKFTTVYSVKMVKANKNKGVAKCALVSCQDGDGVRTVLDAARKHTLHSATLTISLQEEAPPGQEGAGAQKGEATALEDYSSTGKREAEEEEGEEPDAKPPSKKRRKW